MLVGISIPLYILYIYKNKIISHNIFKVWKRLVFQYWRDCVCGWVHYFRSRFLSGPSSGSSRSRLEASAASSSESSAPAAEVVLLVEDRWRVEELVMPPFLTFCKKIRVISRTNLVEPKMLLYSTIDTQKRASWLKISVAVLDPHGSGGFAWIRNYSSGSGSSKK